MTCNRLAKRLQRLRNKCEGPGGRTLSETLTEETTGVVGNVRGPELIGDEEHDAAAEVDTVVAGRSTYRQPTLW